MNDRVAWWRGLVLLLASALPAADPQKGRDDAGPDWRDAMRAVHEKFDGNAGYVAQYGDSITNSLAFWAAIGWDDPAPYLPDDGFPRSPADTWCATLKGFRDKGSHHGNATGWKAGDLARAVEAALRRDKPEVAIIMIGTNDIAGGEAPGDYRENLESIIRACLDHHCIPILNTIPPRRGLEDAVTRVNQIIRQAAVKHQTPFVDYCGEIHNRQPGGAWDGTLIAADGIHPSNPDGKHNVYSQENLDVNGYALRTYINLLAVREIYFRILKPAP